MCGTGNLKNLLRGFLRKNPGVKKRSKLNINK